MLPDPMERDRGAWNDTPFMLAGDYPERPLDDVGRAAVSSLLWQPISCSSAGLTKGQHRACSLKVSGAFKVPILDERLL